MSVQWWCDEVCAHVSVRLACKCNVCDVYEVIGGDLCVCVCDVCHVSVCV